MQVLAQNIVALIVVYLVEVRYVDDIYVILCVCEIF